MQACEMFLDRILSCYRKIIFYKREFGQLTPWGKQKEINNLKELSKRLDNLESRVAKIEEKLGPYYGHLEDTHDS